MKRKFYSIPLIIMLVTTILTGTNAFAYGQGEPYRKPFFMGKLALEILDKLDLTQEQREKLRALHEDERRQAKELRRRLRETMQGIHQELEKYQSDQNRINSLISEMKTTGGQLFELRINSFIKMKQILTPEQYEKFKEELKKRKELMKERGVPPPPPPPPPPDDDDIDE